MGALVAHGGGAPEALTIGLPIVLFAAYLYVERRARQRDARRAEQARHEQPEPDVGSPP